MTTLKKLTNKEFKALERNEDGRLINLPDIFYLLTGEQIDELHEDDWSATRNEYHKGFANHVDHVYSISE